MAEENLDLELEEEAEGKKKTEEKTLEWEMDPAKRLEEEMAALKEKDQMRAVAKMLLDEFAKDPTLAACYKERKVTLGSVIKYITNEARKEAVNSVAVISDETVYGWAIHFVRDGKDLNAPDVLKVKKPSLSKTDKEAVKARAEKEFYAAEMKRLAEKKRKEEERAKLAAEKKRKAEQEKRAQSGQMSLFEFMAAGGDA